MYHYQGNSLTPWERVRKSNEKPVSQHHDIHQPPNRNSQGMRQGQPNVSWQRKSEDKSFANIPHHSTYQQNLKYDGNVKNDTKRYNDSKNFNRGDRSTDSSVKKMPVPIRKDYIESFVAQKSARNTKYDSYKNDHVYDHRDESTMPKINNLTSKDTGDLNRLRYPHNDFQDKLRNETRNEKPPYFASLPHAGHKTGNNAEVMNINNKVEEPCYSWVGEYLDEEEEENKKKSSSHQYSSTSQLSNIKPDYKSNQSPHYHDLPESKGKNTKLLRDHGDTYSGIQGSSYYSDVDDKRNNYGRSNLSSSSFHTIPNEVEPSNDDKYHDNRGHNRYSKNERSFYRPNENDVTGDDHMRDDHTKNSISYQASSNQYRTKEAMYTQQGNSNSKDRNENYDRKVTSDHSLRKLPILDKEVPFTGNRRDASQERHPFDSSHKNKTFSDRNLAFKDVDLRSSHSSDNSDYHKRSIGTNRTQSNEIIPKHSYYDDERFPHADDLDRTTDHLQLPKHQKGLDKNILQVLDSLAGQKFISGTKHPVVDGPDDPMHKLQSLWKAATNTPLQKPSTIQDHRQLLSKDAHALPVQDVRKYASRDGGNALEVDHLEPNPNEIISPYQDQRRVLPSGSIHKEESRK